MNALYAITQRVTLGLQHQQANRYITLHHFSKLKTNLVGRSNNSVHTLFVRVQDNYGFTGLSVTVDGDIILITAK